MQNINQLISNLVCYGVQNGLLSNADKIYVTNRILSVLKLDSFEETEPQNISTPSESLEPMLDWAYDNGLLESNTPVYRDLLDTEIMACLMMRPSEMIEKFNSLYSADKKSATDWYYNISKCSNYIRQDRIAKDILWKTPTKYGDIIITVNLSKPEKDPKAIAAARNMPASSYPKCQLCKENEGYRGTLSHPARGNHRVIPISVNGEDWFMQYSPYVYYNEHCIFFKGEHSPMAVNRKSFERLMEIVTVLPHYFVGSNADLPIVGGSILSHDHFQGGNAEFPMAKAGVYAKVNFTGYDDIEAGLVDWPMSVIRLCGKDKARLADLADKILTKWRNYSDESADIFAFTDGTPHNTITPICRFRDGKFELDLVLRNNRTSEDHPLGIFHPHAQYHHIKKENIGLIEVMGLAILPARLKKELKEIEYYLVNPDKEDEMKNNEALKVHIPWYEELKKLNPTPENAEKTVRDSVGKIFSEILENAGVYKRTKAGEEAFMRFAESCNL